MNKPSRRALIIGGGIAGPALSLFLARSGVESTVFEAYPRADDIGGGLQIAPNGLRVLTELGLTDTLFAVGHACRDMIFKNHHGRAIGAIRTHRAGPSLNVSRADVHRVLRDEMERRGIVIRYEKQLNSLTVAGREIVATFQDGTTEVGDFLVGADGVRSRVRACILPEHAKPRDTRMIALGGFTPPGFVPKLAAGDAGRLTFMVGPRYQLGYGQMTGGQWGWWCHAHAESETDHHALLTMPEGDLCAHMLDRYRGWSAPAEELITRSKDWLRTAIHDVPSLPTWHQGPVLLIGDAAHAMSPAGGQGASMALEDAMLFGKLAAEGGPVEESMARFEALRRERAEKTVAQAYANDLRTLKELGPAGQWMRDRVMMPLFASFIERALEKVYTAPLEA